MTSCVDKPNCDEKRDHVHLNKSRVFFWDDVWFGTDFTNGDHEPLKVGDIIEKDIFEFEIAGITQEDPQRERIELKWLRTLDEAENERRKAAAKRAEQDNE